MPESTRRQFLVKTGAGAAAVSAATVLPATSAEAEPAGPDAPGRLIAYVDDARTGHITLMVGEREVTVHDRDLVNRLRKAAR